MQLTKLKLTTEASNKLRALAGRTKMTPNLLCRLGFSLSLAEPRVPDPEVYPEEEREFNRYTLLGEHDAIYVALLRERCVQDGLVDFLLEDYFRAHMNRGVDLLSRRIKTLSDLAEVAGRQGASGDASKAPL